MLTFLLNIPSFLISLLLDVILAGLCIVPSIPIVICPYVCLLLGPIILILWGSCGAVCCIQNTILNCWLPCIPDVIGLNFEYCTYFTICGLICSSLSTTGLGTAASPFVCGPQVCSSLSGIPNIFIETIQQIDLCLSNGCSFESF